MFVKKIFRKKKFEQNFENNFGKFFILKKIRLIFEKKYGKKFLQIFHFWKKSRLIHQSKDRKLSVKMSTNFG